MALPAWSPAADGKSTDARPNAARIDEVLHLRREIGRMQRRRSDLPLFPVPPALEQLLPEAGLQAGTVYSVSPSLSLVGAVLATTSQTGRWCAVVGIPEFGLEAASAHGLDLSRLILVPDPGERWVAVVSALSEVVPLIAVRPITRLRDSDASRLNARLRDRGSTLLLTASDFSWPQSEGSFRVSDPHWEGLGQGWGLLSQRTVTLTVRTRGMPAARRTRVRLPDASGRMHAVDAFMERGDGRLSLVGPAEQAAARRWAVSG